MLVNQFSSFISEIIVLSLFFSTSRANIVMEAFHGMSLDFFVFCPLGRSDYLALKRLTISIIDFVLLTG